jgi:hypothetical protein
VDASGNSNSCSFSVTVNDSQPPSIICPADVEVVAPENDLEAIVEYTTPQVSDNCGNESVTVECDPPSGSTFPLGITTVTCVASDHAPVPNTSSCSFDIKVIGNFSAVRVLTPNGGEKLLSGSKYTVTWGAPTSLPLFDIEYSLDGGGTWQFAATNIPNNGLGIGTHEFSVPTPSKNKPNSLIRVSGKLSNGLVISRDTSDDPFEIQVVTVISPNRGEVLNAGEIFPIQWQTGKTTIKVEKVVIQATFDAGNTWVLVGSTSRNRGWFNWIVPSFPDDKPNCLIRITLKGGVPLKTIGKDASDEFFTILRDTP